MRSLVTSSSGQVPAIGAVRKIVAILIDPIALILVAPEA
jgi:hypothetical protein